MHFKNYTEVICPPDDGGW